MSTTTDGLDARPGRFDTKEARGLAALDAAPKFPLGRDDQVLIERDRHGAVISTHLPPPVITEKAPRSWAATTHMLCWSWGMYFSTAASSEKYRASMNLASKTAPAALNPTIEGSCHPRSTGMPNMALDVGKYLTGIGFIPASVQVFRDHSELHDEIAGEVFRLYLAALVPHSRSRAVSSSP